MSWDKKLRCLSFLNLGANDSSQERKIICFIGSTIQRNSELEIKSQKSRNNENRNSEPETRTIFELGIPFWGQRGREG